MAKKPENIEPIADSFENVVGSVLKRKTAISPKVYKSTHEGVLPLANIDLNVAVLNDGTRVINQAAVFKAFGRTKRGRAKNEMRVPNRPAFLDANNLQDYINKDLEAVLNIIEYTDMNGTALQGYNALILPKICKVYLDAREDDRLLKQQLPLARASEILLVALADIGITALVDEATGYQFDRKTDALRLLLSRYIEEGLQKWLLTFPDTFFQELDRLYGNTSSKSSKRPQYYGHFINRYVYEPIEHGFVKNKLDKLNIKEDGKRKVRFHQWLTEEGRTILVHQIGRVQGLMEMCSSIEKFKTAAEKQKKVTVAPYLFDDMNDIIE
jgi:hypothetical protein